MSTENRTHGLRSTYRAGCRCVECREARRAYDYAHYTLPCPTCTGRRTNRAKHCAECAAGINTTRVGTTTPTVEVSTVSDPAWRPRWWPPACPSCNGWAYTRGSKARCPDCRDSPGHAMSHADWSATRASADLRTASGVTTRSEQQRGTA